MKKLLFCMVLLSVGLSCAKTSCGCSPADFPIYLVIKHNGNMDLLDPKIPGSYNQSAIKITYKERTSIKDAGAYVFKPFQVNATVKFPYHYLATQMGTINFAKQVNIFYIDFGNGDTDTLTMDSYNTAINEPVNLKINNKSVQKDPSSPTGYFPFYSIIK